MLDDVYHYQAVNLIGLRQYTDAFPLMERYLKSVENIGDNNVKAKAYMRMANLALNLEAYEDLRNYGEKALSLSQSSDKKVYCFSLILIAFADLKEYELKEAERGFKSSKLFCDQNELPLFGFMSGKGLAEIAMKMDDFESAEMQLNEVLAGYIKYGYKAEIISVHALLAKTNLRLKKYSQAEEFANKVMGLSDEPSHTEYKAIASKVLSQRYLESKQYKLAHDYLESHQHYSNLIFDDTKAKANAYQMAKFKHQEQAREIALLNQERQLVETQKELDRSDRTNNVMIMTMLAGSVIFLSLFLLYSHRQKVRYRRLALTDRLTSVYNRGAGQDFAENEFVQVSMRKADYAVIVFDLDLFKNINDSFGHATGDWTLKHVVSVIRPLIRDSDIFTRMGGEEFALFLPYSSEQTALKIAERCKLAVAAIDTKYSGHVFNISASFGVSCSTSEDLSLDPLLKRADIALYASKHSGRNRVTLYTPELKLQRPTDETQRSLVFN
ncbi:GGDEF domain-containing protein [Shewanella pealeana]|uniref:tetratricopeptide repeat-containing diguanylate cyclase n=1 Tax=Shewanella pealeana TaxID=70864 RepID=UPI001CBC64F1|nr:GGDEF domain-containing protein [Shewanella pealeana]